MYLQSEQPKLANNLLRSSRVSPKKLFYRRKFNSKKYSLSIDASIPRTAHSEMGVIYNLPNSDLQEQYYNKEMNGVLTKLPANHKIYTQMDFYPSTNLSCLLMGKLQGQV